MYMLTSYSLGFLTSALRIFVISQSMTKRVRVDLVRCRFGDLAGSNGLLFEHLCDLSIQQDFGAPIDSTKEQKQYIKGRDDIIKLREALAEAMAFGDGASIRKKKAALEFHRYQVEELLI